MSVCTACLRSTHVVEQNGRSWCSWCGDYADRYATRMPRNLDIACAVRIEHDSMHQYCLILNADVLGAWVWPAATVEVANRSPGPVVVHYTATPCSCLDLVVRDCSGERLSRRSDPFPGSLARGGAGALETQIPPGQRLQVGVDPMADITMDAIRTGEYTVQAVFRHEDWQAVSEPVKFQVTRM